MKIEFENLGCIEQGSVELNDFTIFCGKNNSGKTYAMYSLYRLLAQKLNIKFDFVKLIVDELINNSIYSLDLNEIISEHKEEMIKTIEKALHTSLSKLFGVSENEFFKTRISLTFSTQEIEKRLSYHSVNSSHSSMNDSLGLWQILINSDGNKKNLELFFTNKKESSDIFVIKDFLQLFISEKLIDTIFFDWSSMWDDSAFLLPAERTGVDIFYKELFSIRNLLLQTAQNDNVNQLSLLKDVLQARYAEPIKDYLQFLNNISNTKNDTGDYIQYSVIMEKNIVKGKYTVDDFGNIFFTPSETKNQLPLHFCSSTVKSLFGLVFYLEHLAKLGDYLMIDEPELNLHPDNQRQVARVLAQLVNAGLKVVVSTHSDYLIGELNNLMMLQKDFPEKASLMKKYGYEQKDLLDESRVTAYLFKDEHIVEMEKDNAEGIISETFNTVTNMLNNAANEIYFASQEANF